MGPHACYTGTLPPSQIPSTQLHVLTITNKVAIYQDPWTCFCVNITNSIDSHGLWHLKKSQSYLTLPWFTGLQRLPYTLTHPQPFTSELKCSSSSDLIALPPADQAHFCLSASALYLNTLLRQLTTCALFPRSLFKCELTVEIRSRLRLIIATLTGPYCSFAVFQALYDI